MSLCIPKVVAAVDVTFPKATPFVEYSSNSVPLNTALVKSEESVFHPSVEDSKEGDCKIDGVNSGNLGVGNPGLSSQLAA